MNNVNTLTFAIGYSSSENPHVIYRNSRFPKGFTLIEIAIVLVIISTLSALAVPSFSTWISNAKVRSVAEVLQNGMRAAQTEALRRSRQTAFVLTNAVPAANAAATANGIHWYIQVLPIATETVPNPVVQTGSFGNAVSGVTIAGPAQICFNSMGRVVANSSATFAGSSCAAPAGMTTYDLTRTGADRTLEIQVQMGGQVRLCDKSKTLSTTNPDGC